MTGPNQNTAAQKLKQAIAFYESGRMAAAEEACREVLAMEAGNALCLHMLGLIAFQDGRIDDAAGYFARAAEIGATVAAFHYHLGLALQKQGGGDAAIAAYARAIALKPDHAEARSNLGTLLLEQGRPDAAAAEYAQAAALKPQVAELRFNLARALAQQGKTEDAAAAYEQAVLLKPDYADAYRALGALLLGQGRLNDAETRYRQAVALQPQAPELRFGLAQALRRQGRAGDAAAAYEQALLLKPDYAEAYRALGGIFEDERKLDEAQALYAQAVALQPENTAARQSLAAALRKQGRLDDAAAQYEAAIAARPEAAEAVMNLAHLLKQQGKFAQAATRYEQALALRPEDAETLAGLVDVLQHICAWDRLGDLRERLIAAVRAGKTGVHPFTLIGVDSTPRDQLLCARAVTQAIEFPGEAPFDHSRRARRERIRIGYLSADLHAHATAFLMAELFERHDRTRFEIFAYSYGPDDKSAMRRRLLRAFDHFTDLRALPDRAAAQKIHDDGIDILVDLKGYTQNMRLGIPARRPAPVQVNYLGYPGTMGADFIDYIVADRFILPMAQQPFYSERIVQLPDCYQPNDTAREIAPVTPTRAACGLPEKGFVFCSFNNTYKITPQVFDVWMRLLQAVPGSILWLLEANDDVKNNLLREAERRGVAAERLAFAPRMPLPEHLARHRLADLFLDTLPVNAHTTASDALWAGLPVLTCAGETFASRVAGSLLTAAQMPELIAYTLRDYEDLALQLATDPARLQALRERLERTRLQTPLFDIAKLTRHLESAYDSMWKNWQDGAPPYAFAVTRE